MKKILTIFIILIPFMLFAQKGYIEGYIITNNNDTIFGLIKDRKPNPFGKLYNKVYLKKSAFKKKKYSPNKIIKYKKGNELFESIWISESGGIFNPNYTSEKGVGEKHFFKVLAEGKLSYYYREYNNPDSDVIDIIEFFKKEKDNYFVRVKQGAFGLKRKSLAKYFSDCPALAKQIIDKKIKDPFKIVEKYNNCVK